MIVRQIALWRRRRQATTRKNPVHRLVIIFSIITSLVILLSGVGWMLVYSDLTRGLPSLQTLPDLLEPPSSLLFEPTTLYDRTGVHVIRRLENPGAAEREYLTPDTSQANYLPAVLISSTLSTLDPGFWQHSGYTFQSLTSPEHQTLAERLALDLLLWQEPPGARRMLRARLLAAQITARYGRGQVLTWFLNTANFGRMAYGADAAARVYLGKPAARLTLREAAILAAAAQAPALNPHDAPQSALERSLEIIQRMEDDGWITGEQARQAAAEIIIWQAPVDVSHDPAPAFANLVLDQVSTRIDRTRLERGGFEIVTSIDYDLQVQSACVVETQLARIQKSTTAAPECQAARLLPTLPPGNSTPPGSLGASLVIIEPNSGAILAMAGEPSNGTDPSLLPGHTPGTILTPFIYLTGFTRGLGPASLVWDIPTDPGEQSGVDAVYHGPMRLRVALANDYLSPAFQVLEQVGEENAWRTARQMGLAGSVFPAGNSNRHLLSGGQASLLELTRAYAVFANAGALAGVTITGAQSSTSPVLEPKVFTTVTDSAGRKWLDPGPGQQQPVITPALAYLMVNSLSDEPARWETLGHPNPLEIGRPAAAKLGRTGQAADAWTIGFTPHLVVGVWLGQTTQLVTGQVQPAQAAGIWHAVMQYASRDLPADRWEQPQGVSNAVVCAASGLLPTAECPSRVDEIFLTGSEPAGADTLFRKVQINRETGLLATILTPPALIEEKIFLSFPAEALDWARRQGFEIPPNRYDTISLDQPSLLEAGIQSPSMFASVHGQVSITGSAGGDDFAYYRVQIGQGLNPQRWMQLGEDVSKPVASGRLATWDTTGLEGLYAVQLIIVRNDQRIHTHTVLVSVDNQAPVIGSLYPANGLVMAQAAANLVLQAEATDNLLIDAVEFYMDGRLVSSLAAPPYSTVWMPTTGEHHLRVVVTDKAGNRSEAQSTFTIK